MKKICSWCKKRLPDVEPLEDETISHGMCEDCGKGFVEQIKEAVVDLTLKETA